MVRPFGALAAARDKVAPNDFAQIAEAKLARAEAKPER